MKPNPFVWFPHLKFILWTIAVQYPINPNEVTIKKYYTLINNLPVFFPIYPMGNSFMELLDTYPVKPYLDSRKSFMKWNHFIINFIIYSWWLRKYNLFIWFSFNFKYSLIS